MIGDVKDKMSLYGKGREGGREKERERSAVERVCVERSISCRGCCGLVIYFSQPCLTYSSLPMQAAIPKK